MKNYKIAVIPGDGTGPEVVNEGLKVLATAAAKFDFKYQNIDHKTVAPLPVRSRGSA